MSLPVITALEARRKLDEGAILVDIREADEHAREKIPGARHIPLSRFEEIERVTREGRPVVFHCRSGVRTLTNGEKIAAKTGACEGFIVEGGLDAWREAGLPVATDFSKPIDLQRQVQIGAGAMALAGTLLGLFVAPGFFVIPAFVGAGLLVAGVSGFCGLARLLVHAPWNRALKA